MRGVQWGAGSAYRGGILRSASTASAWSPWRWQRTGTRGGVPADYALRSGDVVTVEALLRAAGLVPIADGQPGDVVLLRPSAGQLHLAILSEDGIIHADAMLRRVVERPGALPFPVVGTWRWQGGEG